MLNSEIENLKKELKEPDKTMEDEKGQANNKIKNAIENDGLKDFYNLRKVWSNFLTKCIGYLILCQVFVIIGIGFEFLNFEKYKSIVMAFFIETFAQIVGMGIMVVAFLFKDKNR